MSSPAAYQKHCERKYSLPTCVSLDRVGVEPGSTIPRLQVRADPDARCVPGVADSTTNMLVVPPLPASQQAKAAGSQTHSQETHVHEVPKFVPRSTMQCQPGQYPEPRQQSHEHAQGTQLPGAENGNPQAEILPRHGPSRDHDEQALERLAPFASDPKYIYVIWKGGPHLRPENFSMSRRQHDGISFLDLPGEIRNQIYQYVYNFEQPHVPNYPAKAVESNTPVPKLRGACGANCVSGTDSGFSLLPLCRQIAFEAASLFNNKATAYIPISTTWDIFMCYKRLAHGATLHPVEHTLLSAFLRVKDLHIHLHLESLRHHSDIGPIMLLLRVLQHLKGAKYADRWCGERRNITVHLDHYFADDRRSEVLMQQGGMHNIVTQMGKFEKADFTIAYYVHTGHDSTMIPTSKWRNDRVKEFEDLSKRAKNHSNIKSIRPEIRGVGRWSELAWPDSFLEAATTKATTQSIVWPSYPDHLHGPDRKKERADSAAMNFASF